MHPFVFTSLRAQYGPDIPVRIADTLHAHLPMDYLEAIRIVRDSLHAKREGHTVALASFFYLPHTCFVARYGLDHFEASMQAQYELTQRFTAEFSIRPFLSKHEDKTLHVLKGWAQDTSEHVRRLASEGTRPRLPWAPRFPRFQKDPQPVVNLLEFLKDDISPYVRRSVANNLNDIGKDHPDILVEVARSWLVNASPQRAQLVRHALRSAIKRADAKAF
jgi:3-methyladenine DNA glycosylase AlkC